MDIAKLGWPEYAAKFTKYKSLPLGEVGRVAIEHKNGYVLFSNAGELVGVLPRVKRFKSEDDASLPKVGDWVRIEKLSNEAKATITEVLPRKTKLSRVGLGRNLEEQVIATNIDKVFIVQGLDENFSLARFERFLIMVKNSGAQPIIILNKSDLVPDASKFVTDVKNLSPGVPVIPMSAADGAGITEITRHIQPTDTIVFVGVSGVGKSTIINALVGGNKLATQSVRELDARGKHTTTRREMVLLPSGGILIDTPGIRELQLPEGTDALEDTFDDILKLSQNCRFRDCDHVHSAGCAILDALQNGNVDGGRYKRFLKLRREQDFGDRAHDKKKMLEHKAKKKQLHRGLKKTLKHKKTEW